MTHHGNVALTLALLSAFVLAAPVGAQTVDLEVVTADGAPLSGFRWLLQEDRTFAVIPGVSNPDTLSVSFHTSYHPPVAKGHEDGSTATLPVDPAKRYFVSVLPDSGHTLDGAGISAGQSEVTVTVTPLPLPTAKVTVFVFHDRQPINGDRPSPNEPGLPGFRVFLEDTILGEKVLYDTFGNPLGTTYDENGDVVQIGTGVIETDANGLAVIENLYPSKYGVSAVPPAGQNWFQTTTIEGAPAIDAWVGANEPSLVAEFGGPTTHAFFGFIQPFSDFPTEGGTTIVGRVMNLHLSTPPFASFSTSEPFAHTRPRIALNSQGTGRYCAQGNDDGTFEIDNVPAGDYQITVFDDFLTYIIYFATVNVPEDSSGFIDLGEIPVFNWFGRVQANVFYDSDGDGWYDDNEVGMLEQATDIRFRDGSLYQAFPTDVTGYIPYDVVFPFFHWLIFEVDYAKYRSTGVTVVVDQGGEVDVNDPLSSGGLITPQPQPDNGGLPYRIELGSTPGEVLLEGFQVFLGQTLNLNWGKKVYGPGENGGLSGIVYYASTRAENDPRFAAVEDWEPGIPRVQVNLYADWNGDKIIDDLDGDSGPTLADVDNDPFGWREGGGAPGPEDVDRNGNGDFDPGDAVNIATSDSWDDNQPSGCVWLDPLDPFVANDCFDGLRNWNQVRPALFDGGWIFEDYVPGGVITGAEPVHPLPHNRFYIIEAVAPRGPFGPTYEHVKEEDKNVDFGDEYVPAGNYAALPAECVGDLHLVPDELVLFPDVECFFAGQMRPLPDRKHVYLGAGQNAAADFFLYTEVPVAAQVVGQCLDDTANEGLINSPNLGEKYAPPFLPVTIRDWQGREVRRIHLDEFGAYNALLPSSYTANVPSPSGFAPNVLAVTMNDPGPVDVGGAPTLDPHFNPQYTQTRLNFQFMPGKTTYLDTPVLPLAAHAGQDQFPLDCEFPDGTPKVLSVSGPYGGPYVMTNDEFLTIVSEGTVTVPNPAWDGIGGTEPKTITRDYGFGDVAGTVTVDGKKLKSVTWTNDMIVGKVDKKSGQLEIVRGDNGKTSITAVEVRYAPTQTIHQVTSAGFNDTPIQDAIDAAGPGDIIMVAPGSYFETPIMWKPLRLQGWGSATVINAVFAGNKLEAWREKAQEIVDSGEVDLLPGQEFGSGGATFGDAPMFGAEEAAGIFVLAKDALPPNGGFGLVDGEPNAAIDGMQVVGSARGGGIVLNAYARNMEINNCRISGNLGFYGGGVRSGHPFVSTEAGGSAFQPCFNEDLEIAFNHITQNGDTAASVGGGGGIALYEGSHEYRIFENFICGNHTTGDGGGISHIGLSDKGEIHDNGIYFNESFYQAIPVHGGGICISGRPPLGFDLLTHGSGEVKIYDNVIQGNLAGAGDGGGIMLLRINGLEEGVAPIPPVVGTASPLGKPGVVVGKDEARLALAGVNQKYKIEIANNMIAANIAGLAGGGIAIQDATKVEILHNTIVNNDSSATAGLAFPPGNLGEESTPQPAGIASRVHSPELQAALGDNEPTFSDPLLGNNIIRHNRSFYFVSDVNVFPPVYGLLPNIGNGDPPVYNDLGVLGTPVPEQLDPEYCLLTDTTGYDASNIEGDPKFVREYVNTDNGQTVLNPELQSINTLLAFDEGGNFIDVRFGPLFLHDPTTGELLADYHLKAGSDALDEGHKDFVKGKAKNDIDGDKRPNVNIDLGADERVVPAGR